MGPIEFEPLPKNERRGRAGLNNIVRCGPANTNRLFFLIAEGIMEKLGWPTDGCDVGILCSADKKFLRFAPAESPLMADANKRWLARRQGARSSAIEVSSHICWLLPPPTSTTLRHAISTERDGFKHLTIDVSSLKRFEAAARKAPEVA